MSVLNRAQPEFGDAGRWAVVPDGRSKYPVPVLSTLPVMVPPAFARYVDAAVVVASFSSSSSWIAVWTLVAAMFP